MAPPRSEDTDHRRRTRWWLLALIAVVVLVPAAVTAYRVNREPAGPSFVPFAVTADGTEVDLGTMGGTWGEAKDVNADGVVVGYASTAGGVTHAFLSRNGTMIDLGISRYAAALNDAGQVLVALMSPNASGPHPFLSTDGVAQGLTSDLGPLYSAADIDEEGRIAGRSRPRPFSTVSHPTAPCSSSVPSGKTAGSPYSRRRTP
jgi:probable HAF family extracellular repeat protein